MGGSFQLSDHARAYAAFCLPMLSVGHAHLFLRILLTGNRVNQRRCRGEKIDIYAQICRAFDEEHGGWHLLVSLIFWKGGGS